MISLLSTCLVLSTLLNSQANAMTIDDQDLQSSAIASHSHKAKVTDVVLTTIFLTVSVHGTVTETSSVETLSAQTGVVIDNANVVVSTGSSSATSTSSQYTISTTSLTPPAVTSSSSTSEYVAPTTSSSSSEYVAPTTRSTTSEYVAPTTTSSSSSEYAAPTTSSSSETPATTTVASTTTSSSASSAESSTSSTSTSSSSSATSTFASAMLSQHNEKRALHKDTDPLSWSSDLESVAQAYADSYDCSGTLTHSGKPYGENLALGYPLYDGETGVIAWYDEIKDYDFSNPGFGESTGHFTQVVWKDTTQVGCGFKQCNNEWGIYLVCNYLAQGNVIGEFASEVEPLIS